MLERINNAQELYQFELGSALSMEEDNLDILDSAAKNCNDPQIEQLMRHHQDETRQQIGNIEQAFNLFGWDVDRSPCLPMEALKREAQAKVAMTGDQLKDAVICNGATETEHHEIGVYDSLIQNARALGRDDVAQLMQQNMEQEQHTLQQVRDASGRVFAQMPDRPM